MEVSMKRGILLSTVFGVGCGNVADGNYLGDPLATVSGIVQNSQSLTSEDDLKAYLFWGDPDDAVFVTEAPVEGSFPAAFTLNVYEPPPEDVLSANGGFAIGQIRVRASLDPLAAGDVFGLADADLWYVSDPADPALATTINGVVSAGFNLTVLNPTADACHDSGDNDHDRCVAACEEASGECATPCDAASNLPADAT